MRRPVDEALIGRFCRQFGREAKANGRVYFTGGVSAVLHGWRDSTIDLDIRISPEQDVLFRAIPALKESLEVNVELASPADFLPELPGWEDRSQFIVQEGALAFYHYDFYSQALSKLERGHRKDLDDVRAMTANGLVDPRRLLELFQRIESELYRFPAVDPPTLRRRVETLAARASDPGQ